MRQLTNDDLLVIPLYHGTSSLFLDSIVQHGLAGKNPIKNWNVVGLSKEILGLCENNFSHHNKLTPAFNEFRRMTSQTSGYFNWQHGDTYVSPSKLTAIRYAIGARYGSEILSHTLEFLERLIWQGVREVQEEMPQRFPEVFRLINFCAAPMLVEITRVPVSALTGEDGSDAFVKIELIHDAMNAGPEIYNIEIQQINFRLLHPISIENIRFSLINVLKWHPAFPEVELYEIDIG